MATLPVQDAEGEEGEGAEEEAAPAPKIVVRLGGVGGFGGPPWVVMWWRVLAGRFTPC